MDTKTTLSISEARKNIFKIADDVQKSSRRYTLTEKGRPKAVIMSAEEFESWQETLEVMKDFPDLAKDIEEADRDVKSGKYKEYPTLEEVLQEFSYVLADKGENKYGVSTKVRVKSEKTAKKNTGKRSK